MATRGRGESVCSPRSVGRQQKARDICARAFAKNSGTECPENAEELDDRAIGPNSQISRVGTLKGTSLGWSAPGMRWRTPASEEES